MMMFAFTWPPDAIWVVSQKVFWFVIVLGVLISFHELGHFLAARWVGVKVLKFSLGFGPKLASRQVGDTEYLVSAVRSAGTSSCSVRMRTRFARPKTSGGPSPINACRARSS